MNQKEEECVKQVHDDMQSNVKRQASSNHPAIRKEILLLGKRDPNMRSKHHLIPTENKIKHLTKNLLSPTNNSLSE